MFKNLFKTVFKFLVQTVVSTVFAVAIIAGFPALWLTFAMLRSVYSQDEIMTSLNGFKADLTARTFAKYANKAS